MTTGSGYSLGSEAPEIARLDQQAAAIEQPIAGLLGAAGIAPGMRVFELGSGLGHVAFQLAAMVGPAGSVVAVEQDPRLIEVAERRRAERGLDAVRFVPGDARTFRDDAPFDAVVMRLLLFHLPDAGAVLAHHVEGLAPGGVVVAIDFDSGGVRSEPPIPQVDQVGEWIDGAFHRAGANPRVGARLGPLLRDTGLDGVTTFGVQAYVQPGDATAAAMFTGLVRTLAPQIVAAGLATEQEIGLDTLEARLAEAFRAADAVVALPTVVGAWGRRS
jgi:predicted O-methyltransferase YrrM